MNRRRQFVTMGGAVLNPLTLPGIDCWIDAADTETLFSDAEMAVPFSENGQIVLAMADKTGNGNHLITTQYGPSGYYGAVKNRSSVLFNGDNSRLSLLWAGGNKSQPRTYFICYRLLSGPGCFAFDSNNDAINRHVYSFNDISGVQTTRLFGGVAGSVDFADTYPSPAQRSAALLFNGATSAQWLDGVLKVSGDGGANASNGIAFGTRYNSASFARIILSELIVCSGDASSMVPAVNEYFKRKWQGGGEIILSTVSSFASEQSYCNQGIATDGVYIYSSGTGAINGLRKYGIDGSVIASIEHTPAEEHYGDLALYDMDLYALTFKIGTPNETKVVKYNLALTTETAVADISSSVGYGANGLAFKDGYWFVGETGGTTQNFTQHIYIYDANWNFVKSVLVGYNKYLGVQSLTFLGNTLYVMEHDATLVRMIWDADAISLTYQDIGLLEAKYQEGIAWSGNGSEFYVHDTSAYKIVLVSI